MTWIKRLTRPKLDKRPMPVRLIVAETARMAHDFQKGNPNPGIDYVASNSHQHIRGLMVDEVVVLGRPDEDMLKAARPCVSSGGKWTEYNVKY